MNQKKTKKNLSLIATKLLQKVVLGKNKSIGVAVSGGVDSMVLLDVLSSIRENLNVNLFALHYNHKWRKNSFKDKALIKKYCEKRDIKFIYKEAKGLIIKSEEVARNQRYEFFKECSKKINLSIICTAHHFNDQIETIIFRLLRGTGPRGIIPIKKTLNLGSTVIIRPFLAIEKKEISKYANRKKIKYINDYTNKISHYKRNFIRLNIIPLLLKINKNALLNINSFSNLVYSQNQVLDKLFSSNILPNNFAKQINFEHLKLGDSGILIRFNAIKVLSLNEDLRKAFIYWLFGVLNIKGAISKEAEVLNSLLNKKKLELSKGLILHIENNIAVIQNKFYKPKVYYKEKDKSKIFTLNGKAKKIEFNNSKFIMKPCKKINKIKKFPIDKEKYAYVDFSKYLNKPLTIRTRDTKDVFTPLGFSKKIKLKKYLINKKIPKDVRHIIPLLCFKNEVLWLQGYSLSDNIKVRTKPTHSLKLISANGESNKQ